MAAEDDDGDVFGDFTFACFPPNPPPSTTVHSNDLFLSNGINSSTDDDEWGDFVEFPPQISSTQSEPSNCFDSVNAAANQTAHSSMVSRRLLVKPSGALPLSLFGDVEEVEREDGVGFDLNSKFGTNHTGNESNLKTFGKINALGVNDIISNLYNQRPQVEFENGSGANSRPKVDSSATDLILVSKSPELKVENGFYSSSKMKPVSSGISVRSLDFNGINLNSNVTPAKSFSHQSLEIGSGPSSSNRVDSNANDLVVDSKSWEVKVENGIYSSSNLNATIPGFSRWNMDSNRTNSNYDDGTKNVSDHSLQSVFGMDPSTRVDSNVNDSIVDGKSRNLKVQNGLYSSSDLNAVSSGFSDLNTDFKGMNLSSSDDHTKNLSDLNLQKKRESSGVSVRLSGSDQFQDSLSSHPLDGWSMEWNNWSSDANTLNSNVNNLSSHLEMNSGEQGLDDSTHDNNKDDGDEGWEFKDAYSHLRPGDVKNTVRKMVDFEMLEFSEKGAHSSGIGNGSIDFFGTSNQSVDLFSTSTEVDQFSTTSGLPSGSKEVNLFEVQPSIAGPIGFVSATKSNIEQTDTKDALNSCVDIEYAESDDGFGEFTAALTESELKPREALDNDILPISNAAVEMSDGKVQGKEAKLNSHEGALPLSIFGDEEPETNGPMDIEDAFMHRPTSNQRNGHASSSAVSINDLISNLYSQAEQASSVDMVQKRIEIKVSPSDAVSNSDIVCNDYVDDDGGGGEFDDNTWEFTDAFSQKGNNNEPSLFGVEEEHLISSSTLQLDDFLDFYSRLRDKLCFIAKAHIERLKNAQSTDAEVSALDNQILEASKELEEMDVIVKEVSSIDHPSGGSCLKELIKVLSEPKFLVLESEYHLSEKLLLVEQDLRLAVELIKHSTTMLKILKLGTLDEQQSYVTTWSKLISVCREELKHGALIWKQAIEKRIQCQILCDPQGKDFILALGEIYRVVVILGASAKIFKPWTLSCWSNISILLEECHTLWSTSEFEEALSSVSETSSSLDDASLMKSIKYICGLETNFLQNCIFKQHEPLCRISILSAAAVADMKMITWEDEKYFVTLANLWSNLVSPNPPELPHLHIGE